MKPLHFLDPYLPQLKICSACGLCLFSCPVFGVTGLETDGPRGRLMLLRAFAAGKIAPAMIVEALARCLLCGRCESACPSQIPLERIFFAARFALADQLPVSRRRRFLARLLSSWPGALDFLQPPVRFLTDYLGYKMGRKKVFLPAFQPFARRSAEKAGGVLLFSGCLTRRIFPRVGTAALKALGLSGLTVLTPPELVCCGRPLAAQGDRKGLLKALRTNLRVIAALEFDWLTSPCPACLRTMLEIWPEMEGLSGTEREQLNKLQDRIIDPYILLARYLPSAAAPEGRIYWQRPCLLDDVACQSALRLLGSLPEQKEPPVCCGAPLQCLDLKPAPADSPKLALRKAGAPSLAVGLADLLRSLTGSAEYIVTACPGCMLALEQHITVPVRHLVEILALRSPRP